MDDNAQQTHSIAPMCNVERVLFSDSGDVFIAGWTDDRHAALVDLSIDTGRGAPIGWSRFARQRRTDVEAVLGSNARYCYGFFGLASAAPSVGPEISAPSEVTVAMQFEGGAIAVITSKASTLPDEAMREQVVSYLAHCSYFDTPLLGLFDNLDADLGTTLLDLNRRITRSIRGSAEVAHFGGTRHRPKCSIIVPIYGRREFMFLQNCLYAQGRGIEEYEFIYVCNSPELIEPMLREARVSDIAYGLSQSIVMLNGNAGFAAANNAALAFAHSDRLLCLNPDVFPRDADWAARHLDLIAGRPEPETRFFGSTLYYDDGALMHGGMYFETNDMVAARPGQVARATALRVEHYGKGAPDWATEYTAARPVPAVTGAFMSIDRSWFEALGGFNEEYLFGHYEDADLCLKSLRAGIPVYLHDLRMWHLEGKGSTRRPEFDCATQINRWRFTRLWHDDLAAEMIGRAPNLAAFPKVALKGAAAAKGPSKSAPKAASRRAS